VEATPHGRITAPEQKLKEEIKKVREKTVIEKHQNSNSHVKLGNSVKSFKKHRQDRSRNRPPWPKRVLQEEAARESTREQVEVALHHMINKLH